MKKCIGILSTALFSAAIAFFVSAVMLDKAAPLPEGGLSISAEADARTLPEIAARVSPSVVGVSATQKKRSFSAPASVSSMGSGVIVSENGYILTNHHVIGENHALSVTLSDGHTLDARRIWSDAALDIAVIQVQGRGLVPAPLGDSAGLAVGEQVLAIGNPLSLQFQRTVTAGIVSATNRMLFFSDTGTLMEDLIQTDASINPGNSGGPLVNMQGEVVGINTIKAQNAEGMGFAISINLCRPIIDRILAEGSYTMPHLGLYAYDKETAQYIEVEPPSEGLYISEVAPKSPAARAGLTRGDIITAIDAQPLSRMSQLREALLAKQPGDIVALEILRKDTAFTATVTLGKES